jgi:hypothetical protein
MGRLLPQSSLLTMELRLIRDELDSDCTEGTLELDGVQQCYTLELPVKDGKPGSAIPPGKYPVMITYSPKFDRDMPLLLNIPNRSDIRIHWGNSPHDTEGCILVGQTRSEDWVGSSRSAFEALWPKIEGAARAGGLTIEVVGGIPVVKDPVVQT